MSTKSANKRSGRAAPRSPGQTSGVKYGLIIGIALLSVIVVVALIMLGQGRSPAPQVSLDKSRGDPTAPVVVVEYADFQCPFCQEFALGPERQLQSDYGDT